MYIANHYVKVNGKMYMKDEVLPKDVSSEKIDWLMSVGAVRKSAHNIEEEATEIEEEAESEEEIEEEAEIEEETEAPEIDVMSGIVQEEPKKTTRHKGGRTK